MSEIVDKAKALMSTYEQLLEHTRTERDTLRAELEKVRCELDDAEERASEAEERCAAEWEKDCGQALRILAQVTKFEWDQDGSPADEVREHIQMTLESLEKQVLSLRAELAAAKDKFTVMKGYIDSFERTLEKAGVPKSNSEGDPFLWNERVGLLAEQSTALAADNARLRAAGQELAKQSYHLIPRGFSQTEDEYQCRLCEVTGSHEHGCALGSFELALAATPAQSLAAHDAALLREVADREFNPEQSAEERWAHGVLHGNADRIAKEAANGEA